uniref:Uncharacterized protein n=1 Tax=Glossina brevipalpis TaxID=37001 RepID=A0A1A9WUK5_9MUSC
MPVKGLVFKFDVKLLACSSAVFDLGPEFPYNPELALDALSKLVLGRGIKAVLIEVPGLAAVKSSSTLMLRLLLPDGYALQIATVTIATVITDQSFAIPSANATDDAVCYGWD